MRKPYELVLDDWNEDEDIYSDAKVLELVENDEITAEEAGFMMGYSGS
jgi:hypothetical protein